MNNKTSPLDYSAVIVEYFSGNFVLDVVKSLKNQEHKPNKIVVVLNGIEESKRQELEKQHSDVHLIDPNDNLGYSKAINLGVTNTSTPIIAVLNPDLDLDKECAKVACEYLANNEDVGAVGPKILESDGSTYPSARNEPNLIDAIGHGLLGMFKPDNKYSRRYKNLDLDENQTRDVDWLSGAAQFLRRVALDDVGGWDEDFFMYCEDVELGRQMKLHNWKSVYCPGAVVTHEQGVSSSATPIKRQITHHKSLYKFTKKKYENNLLMQIGTAFFIAVRLPIAIISSRRSLK